MLKIFLTLINPFNATTHTVRHQNKVKVKGLDGNHSYLTWLLIFFFMVLGNKLFSWQKKRKKKKRKKKKKKKTTPNVSL